MATTDTNVSQVVVNKLTKAQYTAATKSSTEFYAVTDDTKFQVIAGGSLTDSRIAVGSRATHAITFPTQPDTNYACLCQVTSDVSYWTWARFLTKNKTTSGCDIIISNDGSGNIDNFSCDYIVIKY